MHLGIDYSVSCLCIFALPDLFKQWSIKWYLNHILFESHYAWYLMVGNSIHQISKHFNSNIGNFRVAKCTSLDDVHIKVYCRYEYTKPCIINHIWGLKQLLLQVNGHAWFHLLRWPVRNGELEGAKNSKWKYMSPVWFEPTPRQSTTGKSAR